MTEALGRIRRPVMGRILGALLGLLLSVSVSHAAGTVTQGGSTVTPNTVSYWLANGVIGGTATSADSPITSFGVTNGNGNGICDNSARVSSGAWIGLCLGFTGGIPTISVQNYGAASTQPLQFIVNGTTYPFPGSLTNITIGTTPVVGGATGQCLYVTGGVVGQQNCTLSAITSLMGTLLLLVPAFLPLRWQR